ncbi:MAG: chaperone CsaA [Acidimicrobiia bacterium]|nr:MAG: chaperone CsaA [Acidimicrobiia bacterium]
MAQPTISDFLDMALLVGTVVRCEVNTGARDPALCLWIDFGSGGTKQSSAKITDHYDPQSLVGRQVVAVTGFEPIRVGGFRSEVLVVGALTDDGVVLLAPDRPVAPGSSVA